MAYEWKVDPQDLFEERAPQMVSMGLPSQDVIAVRAAVTEMWPDRPGGWVYEWSQLAARYAESGQHRPAVLAYGYAKFPSLADDAKRTAHQRQLEQYLLAAAGYRVAFERQTLDIPCQGAITPVPVHLLIPPAWTADAPVLLASGGVDTWKMDIHGICEDLALRTGLRVVAFDIPGTGESTTPMTADGGADIVRALIGKARHLGNGHVIHLGISMGGHFSARSGLVGDADAAINIGGPVATAFAPGRGFAHGMSGIIGNALGFDQEPTEAELGNAFTPFSLQPLLDDDKNAPMLVVNGADDVHVPREDTLVFNGRRDTEVHLLPGTGHCAMSKWPEVATLIVEWIGRRQERE
ncbi:alpha/beta hydrolase [Streptomyces sp. NBC_00996]|uniref:alpha/beta hydrolase n=1 Tax=Streptomyces sp. NBC_00996 TaxID=2903710 RepID=UPI00386B55B1|nr:alpha/beta hydrolase [Streptomyces sp. NBC_00996]